VPVRTDVLMGTLVTIEIVRDTPSAPEAMERAFGWFHAVEDSCTRFVDDSELMRLSAQTGVPIEVSAILFEAVQFAIAVAQDTGGALDPTVGARVAARGFDREHRTGRRATPPHADPAATYRDVRLDTDRRTITLDRPLTLDLGAVAKGLAVDAAARELRAEADFAIDAGGDLMLAGRNRHGEPWTVGIRHPRRDGEVIETLRLSDIAVCTSGDYERAAAPDGEHHVIDPRTGRSPAAAISATVIAPTAMLADALATAALVLGPDEGIALLERHGVGGVIYSSDLRRHATVDRRA
jgi:thiamine biosynthesis lipoprotein